MSQQPVHPSGGSSARGLTLLEAVTYERDAQKALADGLSASLQGRKVKLKKLKEKAKNANRAIKRAKDSIARFTSILAENPGDAQAQRFLKSANKRMAQNTHSAKIFEKESLSLEASMKDSLKKEREENEKLALAEKRVELESSMLTLDGVPKGKYLDFAKMLAKSIVFEIPEEEGAFPNKSLLIKDWLDRVESREGLRISCEARVKSSLGIDGEPDHQSSVPFDMRGSEEGVSAAKKEKLLQWFLCMTHAGFAPRSGMDMEHADPYEHIRKKQERFLSFLNRNIEFAKILSTIEPMNEFIKVDLSSGKVFVSKYFILRGYNAIDNMWLLCHVCNLVKGASDPVEWVGEKPLFKHPLKGVPFREAVLDAGDLQQGILVDRIFMPEDGCPTMKLGDGTKVFIHQGDAEELGVFIRRWFTESNPDVIEKCMGFESIVVEYFRRELWSMIHSSGDTRLQVNRYLETRLLILNYLQKGMPVVKGAAQLPDSLGSDTSKSSSGSSSDEGVASAPGSARSRSVSSDESSSKGSKKSSGRSDSGDDGSRGVLYRDRMAQSFRALMEEVEPIFHTAKKIIRLLDHSFGKDQRRVMWEEMDEYLRKWDWRDFSVKPWDSLYENLVDIASSSPSHPSPGSKQTDIKNALDDFLEGQLEIKPELSREIEFDSDGFDLAGGIGLSGEDDFSFQRHTVFNEVRRRSGSENAEDAEDVVEFSPDSLSLLVGHISEVSKALKEKAGESGTEEEMKVFLTSNADSLDSLLADVVGVKHEDYRLPAAPGGRGLFDTNP